MMNPLPIASSAFKLFVGSSVVGLLLQALPATPDVTMVTQIRDLGLTGGAIAACIVLWRANKKLQESIMLQIERMASALAASAEVNRELIEELREVKSAVTNQGMVREMLHPRQQ